MILLQLTHLFFQLPILLQQEITLSQQLLQLFLDAPDLSFHVRPSLTRGGLQATCLIDIFTHTVPFNTNFGDCYFLISACTSLSSAVMILLTMLSISLSVKVFSSSRKVKLSASDFLS